MFFVPDHQFQVICWNREAERSTVLPTAEIVRQAIRQRLPEFLDIGPLESFQLAFNKKMTIRDRCEEIAHLVTTLTDSEFTSRAGLFGGKVAIRSAPGHGGEVRVQLFI